MEPSPRALRSETAGRPLGPGEERLRHDVALLCDLVARGVEVDGEAVMLDAARWIIYGRSSYDGELILAEYDDPDEAAAVLREVPRRPGR
jgi:hypothetical protein